MPRYERPELNDICSAIANVIMDVGSNWKKTESFGDEDKNYLGVSSLFEIGKINEFTEDHIVGCAHAVYGWMPRMLGSVDPKEALRVISNGLDGQAQPFVNGSWVGTSKFLYCFDSNKYFIWDSRVKKAIRNGGCEFRVGSPEDYEFYCGAIIRSTSNASLMQFVRSKFSAALCSRPYFSGGRIIEAALYVIGQ